MTLSFRLFPAQLGDLREAGADDVVILRDMREAAKALNFEKAAEIRDMVLELKAEYKGL